jgi:plastocyanin
MVIPRASGAEKWRPIVLLGAAAAVLAAVGLVLGVAQGLPFLNGGRTLEVSLVAKQLKFNGNNPPLEARRGDTLRVVLRNDEAAGIPHDLVISGPGGLKSQPVAPGETQTVTFRASQTGVYHYSCSLHPGLMDGRLIVRP